VTQLRTLDDPSELASFYADAPHGVRANMIFSADGAAAFDGRAGTLSCPADQNLLRDLRAFADVVLVGAGTARAEGYGPARFSEAQERLRGDRRGSAPPPIAVVSESGRLPDTLYDGPQPPILVTSERAARTHRATPDKHSQVVLAGDDSVDLATAVRALSAEGLTRILCEGGPTVLDQLVEADAVDEICVTIAPLLAGSQPVGDRPPSRLPLPTSLTPAHALLCDGYMFLRYRRGTS
jgi:riboflavin biosynthesis pyrimidine reductase